MRRVWRLEVRAVAVALPAADGFASAPCFAAGDGAVPCPTAGDATAGAGAGAGAAVRGPEATGSVAEAGACVVVPREVAPGARPVVAERRSTGRRGTVLCDMPSRCRAGVWLASAPVVCSL